MKANHNKSQLNFEMNLRNHRPLASWQANSPWMFPSPRSFAPKHSLEDVMQRVQGSNFDSKKNKFLDRYAEANAN